MSVDAVYRGRRARVVGDYVVDGKGWVGPLLDYGDGLVFGVLFGDANLEIEPSDLDTEAEREAFDNLWTDAAPSLSRLPGSVETLPDGTTAIVKPVEPKVVTHPRAHYTLVLKDGSRIDALPTPMLLDQFGRIPIVEAYESQAASEQYPPIWRMRDDRHDAPGIAYSVVRQIIRKEAD